MTDNRFSQKERIKNQSHFDHVYTQGKKKSTPYFVIFYTPKVNEERQFAFVASRRVGNAVQRNLGRRKLKEVVRRSQHQILKRLDMVFIVKSLACSASYDAIEQRLHDTLEDLNLWLD